MIYLDYSATTKVNSEVLDTFIKVEKEFFANANSLHKLGLKSKSLITSSTTQIANILKVKEKEIIYTSGATESNNMAIMGVTLKYSNRGKEIITTKLEHSSINEVLEYLKEVGYIIKYVDLNNDGTVNLDSLSNLLNDNTLLVTIASVNSEVGIKQDLKEIRKVINKYPKVIFHSDVTQSIGKDKVALEYVDLASMSAQKFYGLKGVGILIKKENIELTPLIKGGKSTTNYRSGTPATSLIASTSKALRLAYQDLDKKIEKCNNLNKYLKELLSSVKEVHINSTDKSIPNIINISILGIKPETMLHALEQKEIYISTKTACSKKDSESVAVYEITKSHEYAEHSLRISLSYLTEKEELDIFVKVLKEEIEKLKILN